jgi:extracellular factor (EF) 3-hydroxypalmitic acid methyl ester biosynthesis protein
MVVVDQALLGHQDVLLGVEIIDAMLAFILQLENSSQDQEKTLFMQIDKEFSQLYNFLNQVSTEQRLQVRQYFNQTCLPYFLEARNCRLFYDKPRGYAGDFEMMELIWQSYQNPSVYRYQGISKIGQKLNALIIDQANCKANVFRVNFFSQLIAAKKPQKLASFGSGGAIELREIIQATGDLPCQEVYLFDSDPESFAFLVKQIPPSFYSRLHFKEGNVFKTLLKQSDHQFDLIYSSGLFDYLDMNSAAKLANKLLSKLAPQGQIWITNITENNPTKIMLEFCADWSMIDKTPAMMRSLCPHDAKILDLVQDSYQVYRYLSLGRD